MIPHPPKPLTVQEISFTLRDSRAHGAIFAVHFEDCGGGAYPVLDLDECSDDNNPSKCNRLALDGAEWTALAEWMKNVAEYIDNNQKEAKP